MSSVQLTVGTALPRALLLQDVVALVALALAGTALSVPALRRATPAGTLTARPDIGAGIVLRALLCGVQFGSEAFIPPGLQALRGQSATAAGLSLCAGALTWVLRSFLQARFGTTHADSHGRSVAADAEILLVGAAAIATTVLVDTVPASLAVAGWAVSGWA
ncbi:hypothetical protein [Nocardioides zeae]|uniref:MFS transporter n=1 Tax=Nocardioides zeae TaxID=1457234 RepID=A0A6P0HMW5_9ACTN|nr:hypothetical protein [Nocardioides zeae]NEN79946.1 hypothetical protein [Nocardioides zeae]